MGRREQTEAETEIENRNREYISLPTREVIIVDTLNVQLWAMYVNSRKVV